MKNHEKNTIPVKLSHFEILVRRTIRKNRLIELGDHILVGVSGGADSVALVHCLCRIAPEMRLSLTVAHLNHGIRGDEAKEDADFVRRLASLLQLRYIEESIDICKLSAPKNLEERAREVRYDFLRRAARRAKADKIAVGHNLNDQAETVLMRLLRGCGVAGLAAIRPKTGDILIRPLLEVPHQKILEYLQSLGVPYRDDSSNRSLHYRRNRVRHELIPYLETRFNPRLIDALNRQAVLAGEVNDYMEMESQRIYEAVRTPLPRGVSIPISGISQLPPAIKKLILRKGLEESRGSLRGIGARHVNDMLRLCDSTSGRHIQLPGGWFAIRQFDNLLITEDGLPVEPGFEYELNVPGYSEIPEAAVSFTAIVADPCPAAGLKPPSAWALLAMDGLPHVLQIRSRRPGDRYGGPGKRKVKRILIDAKVPLAARSRLPMVATGDTVIWIPGFKPAKSFTADTSSGRCVILEVRKLEGRDSLKTADI